jgi:hypothetical protein
MLDQDQLNLLEETYVSLINQQRLGDAKRLGNIIDRISDGFKIHKVDEQFISIFISR